MFRKMLTAVLFTTASSQINANDVERTIVIGERIIELNPWRNDLIKKQYRVAIQLALEEHRLKKPNSTVKLIESFDSQPSDGFDLAQTAGALGVVGYLYSADSFEASQIALAKKIPYLAPTSPLNAIKNEYAYSMAATHEDLKKTFQKVSKRFDSPSIVVVPDASLTNFEYARIYQEAFNVVKTYRGTTAQIWLDLKKDLPTLTLKNNLNILFSGYAFEQTDLIHLIESVPSANKVNMIAHPQWNYCSGFLSHSLTKKARNLYIVSDYFDTAKLDSHGFSISTEERDSFKRLKNRISKEPKIKGNSIDEPIVYVLKDMISIALDAAEKSQSREEFSKAYSSLSYRGASGTYHVKDKKSERRIYLGKWEGQFVKPLMAL